MGGRKYTITMAILKVSDKSKFSVEIVRYFVPEINTK